jgi:hypothetical protein
MPTLADLLLERFKVRTRAVENPKRTSVGTTAVEILANNPNRLGWVIVNLSANTLYLAFKDDVSSTKGIRLEASGGSASMIWDEDFQAVGWAIWGVASGADSAIYAYEVISY